MSPRRIFSCSLWCFSLFISHNRVLRDAVWRYLSACSGGALWHAAGAVGVFVLLEIHDGVSLTLDVRLVDAVQGLQALRSHRVVAAVQRGWCEAPIAVVGEPPGPATAGGSQGVVIPGELGIVGRDHGTLSLLSTCSHKAEGGYEFKEWAGRTVINVIWWSLKILAWRSGSCAVLCTGTGATAWKEAALNKTENI